MTGHGRRLTTLASLATQMRALRLVGADVTLPRLDPSYVQRAAP